MSLQAEQRMEQILKEAEVHDSLTVAYLAQTIGASEASIRRDISELARRGLVHKTHGGVRAVREEFRGEEPDIQVKRNLHSEEKQAIARYAAGLIHDGDVVFLDAGSTVCCIADYVQAPKALFVSSSVECLQRLSTRGLRTYVPGGRMKPGTRAIVGSEAVETLKRFNFTKAFLGANGITPDQGFTTPDPEEAAVKAAAAAQARETFVLADASKFGTITTATFLALEEAEIITDFLKETRCADCTSVKEVLKKED